MKHYVVVILGLHIASAAPPLTLMIDCGSPDTVSSSSVYKSRSTGFSPSQTNSLCSIIHNALPKSVKDGKFFVIGEPDQTGASNDQIPTVILPPKGFISRIKPKFRTPKVKVPNIQVPKLKSSGPFSAPRIAPSRLFRDDREESSSAERMERVKNGMQKMLHVVKVLGQIDQYVSERTRAIVEILSRTFSE